MISIADRIYLLHLDDILDEIFKLIYLDKFHGSPTIDNIISIKVLT